MIPNGFNLKLTSFSKHYFEYEPLILPAMG